MQLPQEQFGTISGVQLRVRRDTGPRMRRVTPQPPRGPGQGAGATPSAPALGFRTVPCGHDAGPVGDRAARFLEMQEQMVRRMWSDRGKNWNEILQKQKDGSGPDTLKALRTVAVCRRAFVRRSFEFELLKPVSRSREQMHHGLCHAHVPDTSALFSGRY